MWNHPEGQKGFTLAEVIIALVLLATAAVFLLRTSVSAHQLTPKQMDMSVGMNLARSQIESLYESVRQDRWNVAGTNLAPGSTFNLAPQVVNGKTYSSSYVVSSVNMSGDGGGQDYRKVVVTVR